VTETVVGVFNPVSIFFTVSGRVAGSINNGAKEAMTKIRKRNAGTRRGLGLRHIMFENMGRFVNDSAASYNLFRHDLAPNDMLCPPPRPFESDG
jgi:hypothetical protein